MMYGGVADKYKFYKLIGEPFKEGKFYYILAQVPFSNKEPEKIRFYTDKKHAVAMPTDSQKPAYKIFGFKNKDDFIYVVKERYLTKEDLEAHFFNNWRGAIFFNNCWYAPSDTILPEIQNKDKIFKCTWEEFKEEIFKYLPDNSLIKEK